MKKILFVWSAFACAMLFTSCENSKMKISPSHITLQFEDEVGLTVIDNHSDVSWSTDNEFVASVDNNGIVTAEHVGTTTITAKDGKDEAYCSVSVTPEYYTYNEPIMDWGCSKQTIISKKGTPDNNQSDVIAYIQSESKAIVEMYKFEYGKLVMSYVVLPLNFANTDVANFLIERYLPVTMTDSGAYGFINAMTLEEATLLVALMIEDTAIIVGYAPFDVNDSNMPARCPARNSNNQDKELIKQIYNQLLNK